MKAVSNFNKTELVDSKFLAGNDILLFPEDVPVAIEVLERHIKIPCRRKKEWLFRKKKF
jgi:hypothetical protein